MPRTHSTGEGSPSLPSAGRLRAPLASVGRSFAIPWRGILVVGRAFLEPAPVTADGAGDRWRER